MSCEELKKAKEQEYTDYINEHQKMNKQVAIDKNAALRITRALYMNEKNLEKETFKNVFVSYKVKDKAINDTLNSIRNTVQENSASGEFTKDNQFHMTISFIGKININIIPIINEIIDSEVQKFKPISIKFCDISEMPESEKWNKDTVRLRMERTPELIEFQKNLTKKLKENGINTDDRFEYTPHFTIGDNVKLKAGVSNLKRLIEEKCILNAKSRIFIDKASLLEYNGTGEYKELFSSSFSQANKSKKIVNFEI